MPGQLLMPMSKCTRCPAPVSYTHLKLAARPFQGLRDCVVVGAMLDQDAPTLLDEYRPE